MGNYTKPLPLITELSKVFYDGCKEGKLLYQKCSDCSEVIFYPKMLCSNCMGRNLEWVPSSGRGKIFSFTIGYDMVPTEFANDTPFVLATVILEEGFTILTNIVECNLDQLVCDMPVEVVFDPVTPEITLPRFKPAG